jgi:hypothetical protein
VRRESSKDQEDGMSAALDLAIILVLAILASKLIVRIDHEAIAQNRLAR